MHLSFTELALLHVEWAWSLNLRVHVQGRPDQRCKGTNPVSSIGLFGRHRQVLGRATSKRLPTFLSYLPRARTCVVATGTLPQEWGETYSGHDLSLALYLRGNLLNGTFPHSWTNIPLDVLDVSSNGTKPMKLELHCRLLNFGH